MLRFEGAGATQPEHALQVAVGELHLLAVPHERENADARRDRDSLRRTLPGEPAADAVAARGQPHRGQAVAGDDRHLLFVEFDLLRPGVGVTGQRKPGWGEGPDDQFEAPALVVNCEAQGCRPERESRLGIVVGRRAADVGDAVQHPLLPALEGRG